MLKIPCVLMRGGTSKGPVILASDLPEETEARDAVLLSLMAVEARKPVRWPSSVLPTARTLMWIIYSHR